MGRAEVPHEVSFSDGDTLTIRKKVGYVLAFLAIAACVVVGLLVYYVGVMGIQCQLVPEDPGSLKSEAKGSSEITKVCLYCNNRPNKLVIKLNCILYRVSKIKYCL